MQFHGAAVSTIAAALLGLTMLLHFGAFMVLCAIVVASGAVWQWSIYLSIRTKLDIKAILSSQGQDKKIVDDESDAGDV